MLKGYIILTLFLLSCNRKTTAEIKEEFFNISSSKFNGYPFIMKTSDLKKRFGLPDEHTEKEYANDTEYNDRWYCDEELGYCFEVDKDLAHLITVDFRDCQYTIQSSDFVLTKDTEISEIEKMFPIAYQNRSIDTTTFSFKYEWVRIKTEKQASKKIKDNIVEMVFEDGKLIEFDYTMRSYH